MATTIYVMRLPKFNASATCRKCGGDDISTRWCNKTWHREPVHTGHIDRDHMHRGCRTCGYAWLEQPTPSGTA